MTSSIINLKKTAMLVAAVAFTSFVSIEAASAAFTDTFDSIDPAWVTDRYEPEEFVSEYFLGDNRLKITIDQSDNAANRPPSFSSGFYDTQGRQRAAGVGTTWQLSGDLYVDSSFNTTTGPLRRTDLWGRDSNPVEALANYPIFGITNASPTDGYNPSAPDRSVRLRAWDSQIGWIDLPLPGGFQFDAWHNLEITGTGSTFEYRLDGNLIHTDLTGSLPGVDGLQTAFVEAFNFGDSNYSVYWDNVAAVPEPATLGLAGVAMLGAFITRRRRTAA